jgi:predicted amidohydrolase YtcJ
MTAAYLRGIGVNLHSLTTKEQSCTASRRKGVEGRRDAAIISATLHYPRGMTDFQLICGRAVVLPEGAIGDALLVRGGIIVATGTEAELLDHVPSGVECDVHAYPGCFILPGIRDSHLHPVAYSSMLSGVSLHAVATMAELQGIIAAAAERPGLITAGNLNEATLAEKRLPTAAELDAAVADRPVIVNRYDGHLAIVNSAALESAGIGPDTPNPDGGIIDRDEAGRPTGVLRETAIDLVGAACGNDGTVQPDEVAASLRGLAQLGITSIGAMVRSGAGAWAHLGDEVDIITAAAPDIPIRVHAFVTADTLETLEVAAAKLDEASDRMDWAGVKRFGDGSFGAFTAAMFEPFADNPGNTGTMRLNDLDIAMAHESVAAGRAVAIHAIGDAAAARVLDIFEHLVNEGTEPHRLRLEHASVLAEEDIDRIGRLGIVASVQPAFLGSETDWIEGRVGPDRLRRIVPEEGLSAAAALEMYTTAAAQALGEPAPLAVGSPADLVVVDRDPLTATPDELRATEVLATYVGGETVDVTDVGPWWITG